MREFTVESTGVALHCRMYGEDNDCGVQISGDFFFAVPFETEEVSYLVKIDVKIDDLTDDDDDKEYYDDEIKGADQIQDDEEEEEERRPSPIEFDDED